MSKEVNNSQHSRKVGVNRGVAGLTVLSLLATAGCMAIEGGQVVVAKIPDEPTKTSPLSPDLTKTPTPSPTEAPVKLTPIVVNPATQELTLVSPTEVATEIAPVEVIKINMDNVIYPPVGYVKENFEKGEYDAGVETIKQWVNVWEKMGVFEGLEIENNSLSPVPLDGRARIVCVDTRKKGEYSGTVLCPPPDLINGGLKAVSEEGKWDESDKPLSITFQGTEELITKGSEIDMAYQFVDKYTKISTRHIDPKTGQSVEGEYLAPSEEIVLPDIVPEKMNSIGEYDLGMEFIDSQNVYRKLVEGFMSNEEANGDYWRDLLGGNVTYDAFINYLKNSVGGPENKNYWWPMTSPNEIEFKPYGGTEHANIISYTDEKAYGEGIYLDGIYYSFFSYYQYNSDPVLNRFVNEIYKENCKNFLYPIISFNLSLGSGSPDKPASLTGIQIKDNHFVLIVGSMATTGGVPEEYQDSVIGFSKDSDQSVVSAKILSYIKGMSGWSKEESSSNMGYCHVDLGCPNGISYKDVTSVVKYR